jgi:hypothetical protein
MDSQPGMCQHGHSSHPLPVAHLQSPADTQQGHLLQSPTAQIALDQQWLVSKAAILQQVHSSHLLLVAHLHTLQEAGCM